MAYRLLIESYAGIEMRTVVAPLAKGGRRSVVVSGDETGESHGETDFSLAQAIAPPDTGAGGVCSGGSNSSLVDACEFVKRSHSELRKYSSWGRKARESLRRAGMAAEFLDPEPGNWAFYTLTFPACAEGAPAAIAENSGWIVQRVKNILREYDHEEPSYFYVWERQRRGVLHLHYCHRIAPGFNLAGALQRVRALSAELVSALSRKTGINLWVGRGGTDWSIYPDTLRVDYQRVRLSVGRYLAKYCSKESQNSDVKWHRLGSPAPRRWWGCSQSLKDAVASLTVVQRYSFTNYMSASNAFDTVVDKMRLYKGDGIEYSGEIKGVTGRYYSMFRTTPCKMTPIFLKTCSKQLQTVPNATPADSPKPSSQELERVLEAASLLTLWVNSLRSNPRLSAYTNCAPMPLMMGSWRSLRSDSFRLRLEQEWRDVSAFLWNCPSNSIKKDWGTITKNWFTLLKLLQSMSTHTLRLLLEEVESNQIETESAPPEQLNLF